MRAHWILEPLSWDSRVQMGKFWLVTPSLMLLELLIQITLRTLMVKVTQLLLVTLTFGMILSSPIQLLSLLIQ